VVGFSAPSGITDVLVFCFFLSTSLNKNLDMDFTQIAPTLSMDGLSALQNVSHSLPAPSFPQEPLHNPQDLDVELLLISPIGESPPEHPSLCMNLAYVHRHY